MQKLREDPRLATNGSRVQERSWLIPKLLEVIGALSLDDVSARCERASVSWAPVGKPQDLCGDTHLLAGGLLNVLVPQFGSTNSVMTKLPALPVEFGAERSRPGLRSQPPALGEHTAEILATAGCTAAEIKELADRLHAGRAKVGAAAWGGDRISGRVFRIRAGRGRRSARTPTSCPPMAPVKSSGRSKPRMYHLAGLGGFRRQAKRSY